MPHDAQIVYTVIWAAVVGAFALYAVVRLVRHRDPLLTVLLVAARSPTSTSRSTTCSASCGIHGPVSVTRGQMWSWIAVFWLAAARLLTGRRLLLILPVPMVLDAAGSAGMRWPIFSALRAETSMAVKYLAAFATIAMAVALLELTIRYVARRSRATGPAKTERATRPVPA